jgi:hypothetical protein
MAKIVTQDAQERALAAEQRKKAKEMRTWIQMVKLSDEGIAHLDARNTEGARVCLQAIRGIAGAAEERWG